MDEASIIYQILLLCHIAAAIVGFGAMVAIGAYNASAFSGPADQAALLLRTTQSVSKIAYYGIYAVLIFGVLLVGFSDGGISFGDPWISASFVVWFAVVGVIHGIIRPASGSLADQAELLSGDQSLSTDDKGTALGKRLAMGEAISQVLVVIALILMIWQPGT